MVALSPWSAAIHPQCKVQKPEWRTPAQHPGAVTSWTHGKLRENPRQSRQPSIGRGEDPGPPSTPPPNESSFIAQPSRAVVETRAALGRERRRRLEAYSGTLRAADDRGRRD